MKFDEESRSAALTLLRSINYRSYGLGTLVGAPRYDRQSLPRPQISSCAEKAVYFSRRAYVATKTSWNCLILLQKLNLLAKLSPTFYAYEANKQF